jgi:glucose-6-phosphate 1-dehydrogenase
MRDAQTAADALDGMRGDATPFTGNDEVEAPWRI